MSQSNGGPEVEKDRRIAAAEERAIRTQAEARTAHLPGPGEPYQPPLTPAQAAALGEPMVRMVFPGIVTLTLPGYRMVRFEAGVQDVPASLVDDPYVLASGARRT
jgi:hypothetical protein